MRLFLLISLMLVTGCAATVSESQLCQGTLASRKAHAAALASDPYAPAVLTGQKVLAQIGAACGDMR